jgi:hypothetical protein
VLIKNTKGLRYYLYISASKIEMLYPQLSADVKEKKAAEWKIDVKFLSYSRKSENEPTDTQPARLEAIVETLNMQEKIGTIEEPREYFAGCIKMRWGIYADNGRPNDEPPLIYFGGTSDDTVCGLGGSSRHVIGFRGAGNTGSRSVTPYLIVHLLSGLDIPAKGWNASLQRKDTEQHVREALAAANQYLTGPELQMEFVAKTLLIGRDFLLGTPLYVVEVGPFDRIGFN